MRKLGLAVAASGLALSMVAGLDQAAAASPTGAIRVAQAPVRPAAAPGRRSGGIGDFGAANNNKPINVEADKLEVFQKDGRAVYTGSVIAVQGETTMKCSQLVVFFDQSKTGMAGGSGEAQASPAGGGGQGEALKKLECKGPVSVVAKSEGKTQVATGDNAVYDRVAGLVTLSGNVTLSDGSAGVTKCASFAYNTNSSQALCTAPPGGRVSGVFETGGDGKAAPPSAAPPVARPKPKTN